MTIFGHFWGSPGVQVPPPQKKDPQKTPKKGGKNRKNLKINLDFIGKKKGGGAPSTGFSSKTPKNGQKWGFFGHF